MPYYIFIIKQGVAVVFGNFHMKPCSAARGDVTMHRAFIDECFIDLLNSTF